MEKSSWGINITATPGGGGNITLIYSSKRHIRPHRTILFGGLRVGVLGVVRVSIRVRVGVALERGQFGVRFWLG